MNISIYDQEWMETMTSTEQDKELHSKSYKLAQEYLSTNNLEGFVDLIQNNLTLDEALQLITADRKRVALEARIDELKHTFVSYDNALASELVENPEWEYGQVVERIAELQAQKEEI